MFIVFVLSNVTSIEQEKEYKMCLDAYNEKSNEKATLVNRLMEVTVHLLQVYNMRVLHFFLELFSVGAIKGKRKTFSQPSKV